MKDPFDNRIPSLNGPGFDLQPVTPDDGADLSQVAVALYIETGGTLSFVTAAGVNRSVTLPDYMILPVGTRRVLATGTTATGIHAFTVS